MQVYFTAIQAHLEDRVDFCAVKNSESSTSSRSILSLGVDNLIYLRDVDSGEEQRIELSETASYRCVTDSPAPGCCILGSETGTVQEFNLQTKQTKHIFKSQYRINSLVLSPSKRYLAVGSEESKSILVDLQTLRVSKCRPGHQSGVVSVCFDAGERYLASIGMDRTLFIYSIGQFQQPVQQFHMKISHSQSVNPQLLSGSFNKSLDIFYSPGMKQLQIIQLLNNKWQHRLSKFVKHSNEMIELVKMIKVNLMVTSSGNEFIVWNNRTEEKIVEIEMFGLNKVVEVGETFWGCRHDGRLFECKKVLQENIVTSNNSAGIAAGRQQMEIEPSYNQRLEANNQPTQYNTDVLMFEDEAVDYDGDGNVIQEDEKSEISYHQLEEKKKKSKADRLITAYPQAALVKSTSIFDSARYLATGHQGYLIERIQGEYEIRVEFQREDSLNTQLLFINKKILYADFNSAFVVYANQTQYGLKFLKSTQDRVFADCESWEHNWEDVVAVASGYQWMAVANDQEIKVVDVTGNQIKTIAFDRLIVAMAAYENLLAVVYHESIPIEGSQCLSMKLYVVNHQRQSILNCSTCHVPLSPKSVLKYFAFSEQGMLVSHDQSGAIRVYSLETNTWTNVIVQNVQDTRRIWLLGMKDYRLIYWKASQLHPDPQVFPRLPVKQSRLGISIQVDDTDRMSEYPYLMFERYSVDHEKCRSRLWLGLKHNRTQKYPGYKQHLSTILSPKEISQHHNQLDYKFFQIIKVYLENVKTHLKALMAAKNLIRTIEAGKRLIDIFDDLKLRALAVELEIYFEEKEKELEYEMMQTLEMDQLRAEAEKNIKPKGQNNPFNRKKNNDLSSIPSLNNSQISQVSNFDNLSEKSSYKPQKENETKVNTKIPGLEPSQKEEFSNPFLKKRSNDEDGNIKARQIEEQIEKYGIKKKVDLSKRPHKKF